MIDTTPVAQATATPESASVAELSLADYRASRTGEGAAKTETETTPASEEEQDAEGGNAGVSDSEEGTADDSDKEGEKPANKKRGGFQRKLESKDREIENLKAQLAQAAGKPAGTETAPPQAATPAAVNGLAPKPKMDDFDSIEAFTEALTDWKADEREARRAADAESKKILDGWNSRQAEAKKTHSDYDEVIEAVSDIKLNAEHQRLFLESEAGAEIAYQLASDPDELKKFAAMSPLAAARYFGKLEATYTPTSPASKPRVSNAPRPISPVGGRSTGTAAITDVSKLPLSAYRELRTQGRIR